MDLNLDDELEGIPKIEISYTTENLKVDKKTITCSHDCYEVLNNLFDPDTIELYEEFKVLYLNKANQILGFRSIGMGTTDLVAVNIKLIIAIALLSNSSAIVLSHNHPSGRLRPSKEDEKITKKIVEAGKFFNIKIHDHLVLTKEQYFSFTDEGLL